MIEGWREEGRPGEMLISQGGAEAVSKVTANCHWRTLRAVSLALLVVLAFHGSMWRASPARGDDGEGRLVSGDQITVTVFGQTDLSGNFQVDGKGFIEMPLIGAVPVRQLTLQECERAIASRLADGYINRPVVSVRIGEVRPIYVVGDVRTPGAYPFRHGSTALSAIAHAGGYGTDAGGTLSDFLLADERLRTLESSRRIALIRMARLEAQRDGKTSFVPPVFRDIERDQQITAAIANENEALRTQLESLEQELALHREQKPRLESAYKSIEEQITAEKHQSALLQTQLKDLEDLSSKGLSMRSREITLQRERATMDSNISRYRSELARLAVTIGEVDIKVNDAMTIYRRRVLGELDGLRKAIQDIDAAMPSAREMRDVRSQQAANSSGVGQTPPIYRLFLRRSIDSEMKVLTISGEMLLQPGDVVEVKRLRLEGAGIPLSAGGSASSAPPESLTGGTPTGGAATGGLVPGGAASNSGASGGQLRSSLAEESARGAGRSR